MRFAISTLLSAATVVAIGSPPEPRAATVGGEAVVWHEVVLDFDGPTHDEMDVDPNPFLDYRLQVLVTSPDGARTYDVPGFFDGDGSGGGTGSVWRARFAPDEAGTWTFEASFRTGPEVAVDLDPEAGTPTGFDGETGTFVVGPADPAAPGFLGTGRPESVGEHVLRFRDGSPWLKLGTNNPENLLGYEGFDNTTHAHHAYANHVQDWQPGDPDWDSPDTPSTEDGRGIIGALNYLAGQELNSIYFMPMNIGADGKDVWPYADPSIDRNGSASNDNLHFDVSKLAQWEIVFDHAQRKGLFLHWVLSDKTVANKNELDGATLGVERKLFYREMAARFAHHNGMQWNLCEEYNLDLPLDPDVVKQFGEYMYAVDPYRHPITVHSHGDTYDTALAPFLTEAWFKTMSVQVWQRPEDIGYAVEYFLEETTLVGNTIPVNLDECVGMNQISADDYRRRTFWDALLSGGGFEMFKSYGDWDLDDFRVYEEYYRYARYARRFVEDNLPYDTMEPADERVTGESSLHGGAEVLARAGAVYAIYLPEASPEPSLDLTGIVGSFEQTWYDPRTGTFSGAPRTVTGGGIVGLGSPPSDPNLDWAILLRGPDPPPARRNGRPAGTLPPGTTGVTLGLDTDVAARCRYAAVPGTDFHGMTDEFETTGDRSHETPIDGLEDGRSYAYFARCEGLDGIDNPDDYTVAFTVDSVDGDPIGDRAVWYIDEGSGAITADASGRDNHGELVGGPVWSFGYSGSALEFDGIGSSVRVNDTRSLDFTRFDGLTVAAWVRPRRLDHSTAQTVYGHWSASTAQRSIQILVGSDNRPLCRTNHDNGWAAGPDPVALDTWVHLACAWSPAGLELFVDGTSVAVDPDVDPSLVHNDGLHTLGAREKDGVFSQHFAGILDEVHVFGRRLTSGEVADLYVSVECVDADADGLRGCDGDCDEVNPECSLDCTDTDGDGLCAGHDCDDGNASAGSIPFAPSILFPDRDTLAWDPAADVRWRRGDLAQVATYGTSAAGSLDAATSMDVSADVPAPGNGVYYLIREQGCGSWQTTAGAEPGRDADLPLP